MQEESFQYIIIHINCLVILGWITAIVLTVKSQN